MCLLVKGQRFQILTIFLIPYQNTKTKKTRMSLIESALSSRPELREALARLARLDLNGAACARTDIADALEWGDMHALDCMAAEIEAACDAMEFAD